MVWLPFEIVTENIGMSFHNLIPLLAFVCGLVFFAINFKLGVVLDFIIFLGIFIWFYEDGINFVPTLVLGFIMLVLMAFSLYAVNQRSVSGGRLT